MTKSERIYGNKKRCENFYLVVSSKGDDATEAHHLDHNGTCNIPTHPSKGQKTGKNRSISMEQISAAAQFCDAVTIS